MVLMSTHTWLMHRSMSGKGPCCGALKHCNRRGTEGESQCKVSFGRLSGGWICRTSCISWTPLVMYFLRELSFVPCRGSGRSPGIVGTRTGPFTGEQVVQGSQLLPYDHSVESHSYQSCERYPFLKEMVLSKVSQCNLGISEIYCDSRFVSEALPRYYGPCLVRSVSEAFPRYYGQC